MLTPDELVNSLLALPDPAGGQRLLLAQIGQYDRASQEQIALQLKGAADTYLRSSIDACLRVVRLIYAMAEHTGREEQRALALLADANAQFIAYHEYKCAIQRYDEATDLYRRLGRPLDEAKAQIGKIWPMAALGSATEALAVGQQAGQVLAEAEAWLPLAKLTVNMAAVYGRMGEDSQALAQFNQARALYYRLGAEGEPYLCRVELNRAIVLRNLGQFEASIAASQTALALLSGREQKMDHARAQQSLAITYFVLGRYNEALVLLDEVHQAFLDDGRQRDAILVDLFISDCLLQMRRFDAVLDKCQQARTLFQALGTIFEMAQAILNEAVAYAGLARYDEALASLAEARQLFAGEQNMVWVALTDVEVASLLQRQGSYARSLALAQECAVIFASHQLPVAQTQANLVAGRAALALGQWSLAAEQVQQALAVRNGQTVPALAYQAHYLLGQLAQRGGQPAVALAEFDAAIAALERLRGRLMVEFRADFLEDKQVVYEEAVGLCLDLSRPGDGLAYAERAKSRALLDMLTYKLDIGVQARRSSDQPLVEALQQLRLRRDQLYRRWESREGAQERGWASAEDGWQQTQQEVLELEKQITELWHKLLVRNADYARDAALWQVRSEPIQPYVPPGTLLLEYFVARGSLILFMVTQETLSAVTLPATLPQVQQLLRLFWLNLQSVPRSDPGRVVALQRNVQGVLQRLYQALLAPVAGELAGYSQLIVVPHGPLHYLPFHALHDGQQYLLAQHEISYLPGGSFLRYQTTLPRPGRGDCLVLGNSHNGQLPYTVQEAETIAALWGVAPLLEDAASLGGIKAAAPDCRVLHLATHGDFRPDNPLFSGLALADGWLTTLDIFSLRLNASLVTLSACQTGRNVVAGGDELLGLMRALLYAGASSVVLSYWAVEDQSTARLMADFYSHLAGGSAKGAALRAAQQRFAADPDEALAQYRHPYYWAPFFMVGETGAL